MPALGPATAPLRWRQVFPGQEHELARARDWVAGLLPDYPPRADVLTVAAELAANAVRHTASGWGGFFAMEITLLARPATIRVAVADGGGPVSTAGWAALGTLGQPLAGGGTPDAPGLLVSGGEPGRGLRLVRALSLRTGLCGGEPGRLVWADVRWDTDEPSERGLLDGYHAALREVQAVLSARYPEAAVWFGHATLQWWALVRDPGAPARRLLTAGAPLDLARLLDLGRARQQLVARSPQGRTSTTGPGRPAATGPGRPAATGPRHAVTGPQRVVSGPPPPAAGRQPAPMNLTPAERGAATVPRARHEAPGRRARGGLKRAGEKQAGEGLWANGPATWMAGCAGDGGRPYLAGVLAS